jgi:2-polyprenyl-6-methoxyphenol hydroxylase-like FAD-dependent oxidoreductase
MRSAIVLGAGIGGLLAAGALSRAFEHVVVLDRDQIPDTPMPRIGVPQGPQVHAVMKRGELAIESILPGFRESLAEAGGTTLRVGLDFRVFEGGGWHPRRYLGITLSSQTRALLEQVIRQRLLANGNVALHPRRRFRGLTFNESGVVSGVIIEGDGREDLSADLVIDAMGRGSPIPDWLAREGFGQAPSVSTGIDLHYSTILFHVPERWRGEPWCLVLRATAPDKVRGATVVSIEGDRWLLSMVTRFDDRPPTTVPDCLAFLDGLESPEIFNRIRHAVPASKARRFHIPESKVRFFSRMPRYPTGLLPLGDVIGTFNPLLAQGMTVAAVHAEILGDMLERRINAGGSLDLAGLAGDYIPAVTDVSQKAWTAGAYADHLYPRTWRELPGNFEPYHRFRKALRKAIDADPVIHRQAVRVAQLLEPSWVLPRDEILARFAEPDHGGS